jgi:PAS domain S-box-containing protein
MAETFFAEMERYVGFDAADEDALRLLHPAAAPHFRRISDEFYERLARHPAAAAVLSGPEQLARLKGTLCVWMDLLLTGPWDEAYYEKRVRIGRMHVRIALPQRYMFGAMDAIRISFAEVANDAFTEDLAVRFRVVAALHRIIDLELAIMLESYRESFVDKVQQLERLEKTLLERRLAISEARYAEIVEIAGALVVTFDGGTRITFANRQARALHGEDPVGRDWLEAFVAPDRRDAIRRYCERLLSVGAQVPVFETPVQSRRVRWYLTMLPGGGEPTIAAVGIDVTDEHALAERTRRAERLASLGTMAAGLAHEIRNPLNAAHLQLTLVKRRLTKGAAGLADASAAADLASGEMKRLATLVEEFLQFARPQPLRVARGDLRAAAATVVTLMAPFAEQSGVSLVLEGEPAPVEMDEEKIKQVLHNLVRNAIEACERGGRVRVSVATRHDEVTLSVEDTGKGIDPPDAPIFEPFYTNKPQGTGLGLAIALRIVTDHGGRIDVQTVPGGTLFNVALPLGQGTQVLRVG